jgi:NADPH2:quinone reductase
MVPTIPFGLYLYKGIKISIELIYILPQTHRLRAIQNLHDAHTDKALAPEIEKIYNLSECALAHDKSLTPGRAGAILLNTG